jgi:hypothetical protein
MKLARRTSLQARELLWPHMIAMESGNGSVRSSYACGSDLDADSCCEQADPNDSLSGCLAYVLGALDGIGLMKGNSGNAIKICEVPHHVTSMQWILFIREYFDKHPAELGEQGAVLVPRIVNSAFPCP